MRYALLYVLFLFFCLWSPVLSLPLHAAEFARTQLLMGDVPVAIKIRALDSDRMKAFHAMNSAFDRAREIEGKVSEFKPKSETSRLNRMAGREWVSVGRDLLKILTEANRISEATGGAFDITFASHNPQINYRHILLRKSRRQVKFDDPEVKIGISGIAKGYIIDEMSRVIKKRRFKNHLISAGGDMYASGAWPAAVRNPFGQKGDYCPMLLKNEAACTSGLSERGNHILDPRTGRKVNRRGSITVVSDKAMRADALATGLFVLGPDFFQNNFYLQKAAKKIRVCRLFQL